jgi:predicted TIM-barrel fold metal-dependent hydrolase
MNFDDMILASADDHIVEPANMYDQHLSAEHRTLAPRYVLDESGNGSWFWEHEQKRTFNVGLNAVVGRPREEYGFEPTSLEQMRKAAYDPRARVDDMNVAGILCSLNYPTMASFDGSYFWDAKDKPNALRVVAAYNDWHIDEWCGPFPDRFIPNAILPLWDVPASMRELQRVMRKGCRSITFPGNPTTRGLPSIHDACWQPLLGLCADEGVVVNVHIGTGLAPPYSSEISPIASWINILPLAVSVDASDWLYNSALIKFPKLKIALPEASIGWIPYFLDRADHTMRHHGPWTRTDFGGKLPSEVFREHFLVCFISDPFGCRNLDAVGEDIVLYEMDYPHSDCTWPDGAEETWESVKHLPERQIHKITHENFFREYHFNPFERRSRESCTVGALRELGRTVDITLESFGGLDARGFGDRSKPVVARDIWKTYRGYKGNDAA